MTPRPLDPLVTAADLAPHARHFAGRSIAFPGLLAAMIAAEGGTVHTTLRAVQCSDPTVADIHVAIDEFARSAVHAAIDWIAADAGRRAAFVAALATVWAPLGVANDPHALNQFWPGNVLRAWAPATPTVT